MHRNQIKSIFQSEYDARYSTHFNKVIEYVRQLSNQYSDIFHNVILAGGSVASLVGRFNLNQYTDYDFFVLGFAKNDIVRKLMTKTLKFEEVDTSEYDDLGPMFTVFERNINISNPSLYISKLSETSEFIKTIQIIFLNAPITSFFSLRNEIVASKYCKNLEERFLLFLTIDNFDILACCYGLIISKDYEKDYFYWVEDLCRHVNYKIFNWSDLTKPETSTEGNKRTMILEMYTNNWDRIPLKLTNRIKKQKSKPEDIYDDILSYSSSGLPGFIVNPKWGFYYYFNDEITVENYYSKSGIYLLQKSNDYINYMKLYNHKGIDLCYQAIRTVECLNYQAIRTVERLKKYIKRSKQIQRNEMPLNILVPYCERCIKRENFIIQKIFFKWHYLTYRWISPYRPNSKNVTKKMKDFNTRTAEK